MLCPYGIGRALLAYFPHSSHSLYESDTSNQVIRLILRDKTAQMLVGHHVSKRSS